MSATASFRWLGSANPNNLSGQATFFAGGKSVTVSLASFEDARALAGLIEAVTTAARADARKAGAEYLRGAAVRMESGE